MLENANIGRVFVNLEQGIRLRINREVKIFEPINAYLTIRPNAKKIILITTKRCFLIVIIELKLHFIKA